MNIFVNMLRGKPRQTQLHCVSQKDFWAVGPYLQPYLFVLIYSFISLHFNFSVVARK